MDNKRYYDIEFHNYPLTIPEIVSGWHFCREWDGMLVGPGMEELDCCLCGQEEELEDVKRRIKSARKCNE